MVKIPETKKTQFSKNLLKWYREHERPMPWKGEKDPYLVWLSEIILQQTRVEQGWPYFLKFKEKYPQVADLAAAPEDEVMKQWEGLGYYSRARNMHFTAKFIVQEYDGRFPSSYAQILALKGVGPYTAAAISSFAFGLPHAVVDGNVYRVLSRYFGIDTPIDSTAGKKYFAQLSEDLLDKKNPGIYNQAIIDFGATHCTPKNPKCETCLLKKRCFAFQNGQQAALPVKEKRISKRTRYFDYLVLESEQGIFLRKRKQKDIWQNLYDFPCIESDGLLDPEQMRQEELLQKISNGARVSIKTVSKPFKQQLTHQTVIAVFWEISLSKVPDFTEKNHQIVKRENFSKFAFPKIIDRYLQDKSLYLNII